MKLVVDPAALQTCTLQIGSIELPLSREAIVELLFPDYVLVPRASAERPSKKVARAEAPPSPTKPAKVKRTKTGRMPPGSILTLILQALAKGPCDLTELRKRIEAAAPDFDTHNVASKVLDAAKKKQIRREGTRGTYVYSLSKKQLTLNGTNQTESGT